MVYYMRVITIRLDDRLYEEIKSLVNSGRFRSISDVVRLAITEFISKRKIRWRTREELRRYLASKCSRFIPSGKLVEEIRREED